MKSEALKFWETLLWWVVILTLTIPLFISPHIVMGIIFIKLTIFQLLTSFLVVIYLIMWGLEPMKYKPRITWLTVIVIIFAIALTISTIFSIQPFISFWGTAFRMGGLFEYLHYFVYFLILSWTLSRKDQWLKLLQIAIFISLAVILYGLAQYFKLFVTEASWGRIMSTLVNSLTLAQYLLLLFFPTLVYGLKAKSIKLRWWLLSIAALQFITIFLTGARGAIIALILSFVVFVLYYVWNYHKDWFKKALVAILGGMLILSMFIWGIKQLPKPNNYVLQRIASISFSDPTVKTRLHAWGIAWQASKEKFITGYGLDNFEIAFNKYYKPFAEKYSNNETWFDRSHNSFLDYLVMTGIFGAIAYVFLLLIALWRSFKISINKQRGWQKHIAVSLVATLVAYTVFNLSAFDAGSVYIIFFFLLAMLNSFDIKRQIDLKKKSLSSAWLLYILAATFIVIVSPVYYKHIMADKTAGYAIAAFYKKDFIESLELANKSLAYNTFINPAVGNKMIQAGRDLLNTQEATFHKDVLLAIGEIFENVIKDSENGKYCTVLGDYYGQISLIDHSALDKMNQFWEKSVVLAPNRPFLYLNWGSVLTMGLNLHEEAIKKYEMAVNIYPEFPLAYFWLGVGHLAAGDTESGDQLIENAAEMGLNLESKEILSVLAIVFEKVGKYSEASDIYLKLILATKDKEIEEAYYSALAFYYRIGWYNEAYDLAVNYLSHYPDDKMVLDLMSKIKEKAPYIK